MDLIDKLNDIYKRAEKTKDQIETEEATKTAFVMPFIQALGYDIFNPTEVVPEFTCDVGIKKGEKVDYAIIIDNKPLILVECKACNCNLDKEHASQLFRYFAANTPARFGILTNGINYRFFTDIEKPNIMDNKPFLEINLDEIKELDVKELKKFTKSTFHLEKNLNAANQLKYTKEIKNIISEQYKEPSDEFIKFFAKQVYEGVLTKNIKNQFAEITRIAFKQFIKDKIDNTLKDALKSGNHTDEVIEYPLQEEENEITTEEELESYYIVKAILSEIIDPSRIFIRDRKSYCGILLDNTQLKPICRLHFNTKQKYIGIFDENKHQERVPIETVNDIYKYSEKLKETVNKYDSK
ncbi:MAG: type I restriction endonuclease [Methanobacterium sp.]